VVPMAGRAARLAGLPCSKEIFPVGLTDAADGQTKRPVAVCEHLLGTLQNAGITDVYVVIRDGKWDIPAYLGDGSRLGLHLAYLIMGRPWGTPYSIDQAYPFVRDRRVALGFPDMYFTDGHIFTTVLAHQEVSRADVVLGIFPADRPQKADMVELGADQRVKQIVIKPAATDLRHTWGIAVWTPVFTEFLHSFLLSHQQTAADSPELFVGDVILAGMQAGLDVQGVQVSAQPFVDIGTWEDLQRILK
jgi:glucose-1-phosphate thymidylyltransferase